MDKRKPLWKRALGCLLTKKKEPPLETRRELWGREFDLVDDGLDEVQVVHFVENLTGKLKALEDKRNHFLTLDDLSEKATIEADMAAADIKARAKMEAEAEVATILAQANQRAQEMLVEAKMAAEESTMGEVQNILVAARRRASLIHTEAKRQAQLFLIRSREAANSDIGHEVKEAYNKLLYALQELLGKGNDLDSMWKSTTLELSKRETFELEGHEVTHSALDPVIAEIPPYEQRAGESDTPEKVEQTTATG